MSRIFILVIYIGHLYWSFILVIVANILRQNHHHLDRVCWAIAASYHCISVTAVLKADARVLQDKEKLAAVVDLGSKPVDFLVRNFAER